MFEVLILLGYDAVPLANWFPVSRQFSVSIFTGRNIHDTGYLNIWKFEPLKKKPLHFLETSGIDYPVTLCGIISQRNGDSANGFLLKESHRRLKYNTCDKLSVEDQGNTIVQNAGTGSANDTVYITEDF
jgi:hypothetical protein